MNLRGRFDKAKTSYHKTNCRGTALYLAGFVGHDTYVDFPVDAILDASDLVEVARPVEGGLFVRFGGRYESDEYLYHTRTGVFHMGVNKVENDEWKLLHRNGPRGEVRNDPITGPCACGGQLMPWNFADINSRLVGRAGFGYYDIIPEMRQDPESLINQLRKRSIDFSFRWS